MFAYIWLLLVLDYISPGEVEIWEAIVTLVFFPLLVLSAYYTDLLSVRKRKRKKSAYGDRVCFPNRLKNVNKTLIEMISAPIFDDSSAIFSGFESGFFEQKEALECHKCPEGSFCSEQQQQHQQQC